MARRKRAPVRTDPTENADQAELAAFLKGDTAISSCILDDRLAGALDDYSGDPALELAKWEGDKAFEEATNAAATEIDRRIRLLKDAYPFKREHGRLIHTPKPPHLYEFLLALSFAPSYSEGRFRVLPRVFEVLACHLAEAFLEGETDSYRMGWPRPYGAATTLKAAVEELRQKSGDHLGEWRWGPKEGNPADPTPQHAKEQGLDIVAWKKSLDGRPGQLYLLGQCACGKGWDTDAKLADLNLPLLREWISEIASVTPIRAIFTPRHALDEKLPFISRHGGLVFDRTRLTLLSRHHKLTPLLSPRKTTLERLTHMCANRA